MDSRTITRHQATVFIIDDDDSVRKSLMRLLSSANIHHESFDCAEAFLSRENYTGIGTIILDIHMPGLDGMSLHERLIEKDIELPIIFLSGHADIPTSVTAMRRGAMHFLTKPVDDNDLLQAVSEAIEHHKELHDIASLKAYARARVEKLTARELEIMRYIISGVTNKQIGKQLNITEKTVKAHRASVMGKLDASSIVDLVQTCSSIDIQPLHITAPLSFPRND